MLFAHNFGYASPSTSNTICEEEEYAKKGVLFTDGEEQYFKKRLRRELKSLFPAQWKLYMARLAILKTETCPCNVHSNYRGVHMHNNWFPVPGVKGIHFETPSYHVAPVPVAEPAPASAPVASVAPTPQAIQPSLPVQNVQPAVAIPATASLSTSSSIDSVLDLVIDETPAVDSEVTFPPEGSEIRAVSGQDSRDFFDQLDMRAGYAALSVPPTVIPASAGEIDPAPAPATGSFLQFLFGEVDGDGFTSGN